MVKITLILQNRMWPYLNDPENGAQRRPLSLKQLLESMGDISDLAKHDVSVKFWLPQPVADALEELRALQGHGTSEMLRQFLLSHCYGYYVVHLLAEQKSAVLKRDESIEVLFSNRRDTVQGGSAKATVTSPQIEGRRKVRVTTYYVPELGKNVAPFKLWLPCRLRDDLLKLATHVDLKLSQYLREIVISRLLGYGTLPMRPSMLTALPTAAADDWCEDLEVPWREVGEREYRQHPEGRIETHWLDAESGE